MESSQITQLVEHLGNKNPKVKAGALEIILQLTGSKDSRSSLLQGDLTKELLRCVPEKEFQQNALSVLVNFSQDTSFADEILKLNGVQRIIDNLKDNLIEYGKLQHGSNSQEEKKKKEDVLLAAIQLELLLLSNLSRDDKVKENILELHREPDFHGLNFSFMLTWFNHPTISPTFHFFANILANISAGKDTREFILQPKIKLLENIINSILSVEPSRRLGIIRTIRNCLFEYENNEVLEYLTDSKINLFNNILKCMLFNLIRGLSTDPDCDKELDDARTLGKKYGIVMEADDQIYPMSQVLEEVDLLIDILLVATNIEPENNKLELDETLLRFVVANTKLIIQSESLKDKLDVISVQLLKENPF